MNPMRILSAAEMQACDRATSERFGVPSLDLMRAASLAVAYFAQQQFPLARRITVLCGRGNNGGDGLMTARLLAESGLEVTTLLLGSPDALKGDAAQAWRELAASPRARVHIVTMPEELAQHDAALTADLFIDALLGTGFKPPLSGLALAALDWIKSVRAPILAVDLPSGWPADETSATLARPSFPPTPSSPLPRPSPRT
jgi:ADP-dependent NAD(P)H-hydrate dehydratase / NAD(P)H-hydrate epimerase